MFTVGNNMDSENDLSQYEYLISNIVSIYKLIPLSKLSEVNEEVTKRLIPHFQKLADNTPLRLRFKKE